MEREKDFEHLPPEVQTALRLRAVEAVLSGKPQVLVADIFKVSVVSMSRWMRKLREGGRDALVTKQHGPPKGNGATVTQEEQKCVADAIRDHTPQDLDLPYSLWKRKAVVALIRQWFGKTVSVRTAGRYLANWHYTPQKPKNRPYEQNPEEKLRFLHRRFPAIARSAREHGAVLVWTDETGFRSTDSRGRSYAPSGCTPVKDVSGRLFGCNMISGITADGRAETMVFTGTFTAEVFIAFLEMLISQFHETVYLLMDAHPVHVCANVKEWLDEHQDRIRTYLLPGYSPELNPPEMLNDDTKAQISDQPQPRVLAELIETVCNVLKMIAGDPKRIAAYFHNNNHLYAMR